MHKERSNRDESIQECSAIKLFTVEVSLHYFVHSLQSPTLKYELPNIKTKIVNN